MPDITLLDEILAANREFLADAPVPRPRSLGDRALLVFTCMDPRLTALLPRCMGVGPEEMYQVRNAGNRVTDPHPLRSLAATVVLGRATEVLVVGHTDCAMRRATAMALLDGMEKTGLARESLGGRDVREWFGAIASERSNAIEGAKALRGSPHLPPGTPVHALLVDTATGKLEVLDRGYDRVSQVSRPGGVSSPLASGPIGRPASPSTPLSSAAPGPVRLEAASPSPPPPRAPRPGAREAAATGYRPPTEPPKPKPPPVPQEPDELTLEPEPTPKSKPRSEPPPPPPPRTKRSSAPTPFERAEDVLKRLRSRRGKS